MTHRMVDEPPGHDEAIATLQAELEQRVREAQRLAAHLDALRHEIEQLRQRIADEPE